jgi:hypothetical protein
VKTLLATISIFGIPGTLLVLTVFGTVAVSVGQAQSQPEPGQVAGSSSGSAAAEVSTSVPVQVQAPTVTFSANPTTTSPGQPSSTLTWAITNASSVSIDNGIGPEGTSGSLMVNPAETTSYTLTAKGPGGTATASVTITVGTATLQHFLYVAGDQILYVYDLDNDFQLLKQVGIPQLRDVPRGMGAVVGTNRLYISYRRREIDGIPVPGFLIAYNLLNDKVEWTQAYSFGIDSFAITPDGSNIYMPVGEDSGSGIWHILEAANGSVRGSINTGGIGAHDTVASLDGKYVFMGPHLSPWWAKTSTSTNTVVLESATLEGGEGPFTINGKHTLLFSTLTGYFGFQVSDTTTGAVLYTVPVSGFTIAPGANPDHGISLSPHEKEIYLVDTANSYAHVFDVSGLPSVAPQQVADVPLTAALINGHGWMLHTRDGKYVIVGDSGNVISTVTRGVVATLPGLSNSRIYVEIDWRNGLPVSTTTRQGMGYVTK